MADIIEFPAKEKPVRKTKIKDVVVDEPQDKYEYLGLVKKFLTPYCYRDVLCGIMDKDYYDDLHPKLKAIVDSFYDFDKP